MEGDGGVVGWNLEGEVGICGFVEGRDVKVEYGEFGFRRAEDEPQDEGGEAEGDDGAYALAARIVGGHVFFFFFLSCPVSDFGKKK